MPTDGFAELQRKLASLRGNAGQRANRKALTAVGDLVLEEMRLRTPIKAGTEGGSLEQGELLASLKARVSSPSDEQIVAGKEARVVIGPTGKVCKLVAHDVEYGHANIRAGKASQKSPQTQPHPFVRPTAETTENPAIDLYQDVMAAEIQKAML